MTRAQRAALRLCVNLPERVSERMGLLLASVPDLDSTLRHFERLRERSPSAFERVVSSPAALRAAAVTFSYSRFLSDAVVKSPELILQTANSGSLYTALSVESFEERLYEALGGADGPPPAPQLARFRRRQLLRIALRDLMGIATLSDVTEEISHLADSILNVSYRKLYGAAAARYGEPRLEDGSACGFSVIALGKLGGQELNYSSDIDLMFVYAGPGETTGPERITNKEFYKNIAGQYLALLSTYTGDGQCYRVDLRLRPDGTLGEIAISLDGARDYYSGRARDWEKQMLIKARVAAGDVGPGEALLEFVEPLIYQTSVDFRAVEAVSETRQRIGEKMAARRGARGRIDVKLERGGIRDIEFLVQCLQRLHGGREAWVRHGGTQLALFRLRDKGLLSPTEYAGLATAYQFLRTLEHRLQIEEDLQTHTLPGDPIALDLLAARMPHEPGTVTLDGAGLVERLQEHLAEVRGIYERVIYSQQPMYYSIPPVQTEAEEELEPAKTASNVVRLLDQKAPQLAAAVAAANLQRGRERFEHFLEKAISDDAVISRLDGNPAVAAGVLYLFEHSPYFADQLLRKPELIGEIGLEPEIDAVPSGDANQLRRFYRRQMLRIESASALKPEPIFSTLTRTSALADAVIGAAYRIAVREAPPPAGPDYRPAEQMMVIALGRLGMLEFDLGSDADLLFVLPDEDAAELAYWTGVAERMIHTLSSYTGAGVMFTVDTRLRPSGREGDLVQTVSGYLNYFGERAEAWEGITYMKARAVAGDRERATSFLSQLQAVDFRRYGQSMRSREELGEMRARVEREQGPRNPLKAGMGGYYDIDFALMFLRLRSAGIFFRVLNTPERIDVIEKMGHLGPEDARFLRDAATFFRAVDHAQRLAAGHAEGSLPSSLSQLQSLGELVQRWTPGHTHAARLDTAVRELRLRTREFFQQVFGRA